MFVIELTEACLLLRDPLGGVFQSATAAHIHTLIAGRCQEIEQELHGAITPVIPEILERLCVHDDVHV
jgi:hypothetical protein